MSIKIFYKYRAANKKITSLSDLKIFVGLNGSVLLKNESTSTQDDFILQLPDGGAYLRIILNMIIG